MSERVQSDRERQKETQLAVRLLRTENIKAVQQNAMSTAIAGFLSGIAAATFTHPLDVIKTRMQASDAARSIPLRLEICNCFKGACKRG